MSGNVDIQKLKKRLKQLIRYHRLIHHKLKVCRKEIEKLELNCEELGQCLPPEKPKGFNKQDLPR